MTVESTLAHGLKTSVFGSQWNAEHGDNLALLDPDRITSGLLANRPAAGVARRFFFATDNQKLYYDTGAAWVEPAPTAMAHAASHASGGADAVTLAQSQVANLAADLAAKEPANANIQAHIASASNPHSVTKSQVALGNADNTSDAAKPVSTAAQTALNLKANDNAVPHLVGNESIGGVKSFTDMTKFSRGVQVASAADLRVDTNADGIYFNVTGTTTITSIHTLGATGTGAAKGILPLVILKFDGILTLSHSASLILPDAQNITTATGDVLTFVEESAAVWRLVNAVRKRSFCRLYRSAALGGLASGDKINLDAAATDTLSEYDAANFRFKAAGDGFYHIDFGLYASGLSGTDYIQCAVYINGAYSNIGPTGLQVGTIGVSQGSFLTVLAKNDYVELKIFHNLAGTATLSVTAPSAGRNYLSVMRVGS